jgi:hypothetical protein
MVIGDCRQYSTVRESNPQEAHLATRALRGSMQCLASSM